MMGSQIETYWLRYYIGRLFATIVSSFLRLPYYDTQCGAKLIRAELCRQIFKDKFLSKWIFDVELIARTIMVLGYESSKVSFIEVPLEKLQNNGGSKLSYFSMFTSLRDLFRIFWKYRRIRQIK